MNQFSTHTHTHTHTHTLFQVLSHYGLLQDIDYSSLCDAVGLLAICFIYSSVCVCYTQVPNLSLHTPHFHFGNHALVFYVCESVSTF